MTDGNGSGTANGRVPGPGSENPDAPGGEPETREELLERAAAYATTVDLDLDVSSLEWEISERARRRAGGCRYDRGTDRITIVLTWAAYRAFGWAEFAPIVRHELVHAWEFARFGESGHGPRFAEKAAEVDAPRHCRPFCEGRLRLRCRNGACDWTADRHRASKAVTHPARRFRCGQCGAPYVVEHVATGHTWTTNAGYERAREAIGDDW